MELIKEINLNIKQPNNVQLIHVMQGSIQSVKIIAHLYDGNQPYIIPDTVLEYQLLGVLPSGKYLMDGNVLKYDATSVTFLINQNMMAKAGYVSFSLSLIDSQDNSIAETYPAKIMVTAIPGQESEQVDEIPIITQSLAEVTEKTRIAVQSANTANTKAAEASNSAMHAAQSQANAKLSETSASNDAATATSKAAQSETSAVDAANSAADATLSASTAASKANDAFNSANAANTKAAEAYDSANQSQSYAVGTGNVRPNEAMDNAKYYFEQAKSISESLSGALRPMGTVTFANLPDLENVTAGDMYNISDQFITNSNFKEETGATIPAGSNIYKTADNKWDVLAGSPVTGIKGNMESSYRKGNVNLTANDIGAFGDCGTAADGTDLNTLITSGMYFFMAARNYTNMPPNVTNGLMLVYRYGTMCKQIFLRYGSPNSNDSNTYIRMIINAGNTNASATSWQKFSVDQEIASKYLPKTGGTLTGTLLGTTIIGNQIQVKNTGQPQALIVRTDSNGNTVRAGMLQISTGNNLGIWDVTNSKWMCYSNLDGTNVRFLGKADDSYKADTATKATQDGSGNNIVNTYAKATWIKGGTGISGKSSYTVPNTAKEVLILIKISVQQNAVVGNYILPLPISDSNLFTSISSSSTIIALNINSRTITGKSDNIIYDVYYR